MMAPRKDPVRDGEDPNNATLNEVDGSENASDSEAVSVNEEMMPTDAADDEGDEVWATNEGYTPLNDSNGAIFMALPTSSGPTEEEYDDDSNEGSNDGFLPMPTGSSTVFFSENTTNVFMVNDESTNIDDDYDERETKVEDSTSDDFFRSVANQALSSLDREYMMTLEAGQRTQANYDDYVNTGDTFSDSKEMEDNCDNVGEIEMGESTTTFETLGTANAAKETREIPPIDTDAVRRAIGNIRLKAPDLTTKMDEEGAKRQIPSNLPKNHSIIPSAPLSAFRKRSPKAIRATANLSRSATLVEALCRVSCLPLQGKNSRKEKKEEEDKQQETLVLHIIGSDPIECESPERIRFLFAPFVRWISAMDNPPKHIKIYLIGPNVPDGKYTASAPLDLTTKRTSESTAAYQENELKSATAICINALYHDYIRQQTSSNKLYEHPDLVIAFNAGIWGYDEWRPTLHALCVSDQCTRFVVTSYTIEEAEDDADVVEQILLSVSPAVTKNNNSTNVIKEKCLWKAELNPFGSKQVRETKTAIKGREYHENGAWQAWRLGGK